MNLSMIKRYFYLCFWNKLEIRIKKKKTYFGGFQNFYTNFENVLKK